MLRTALLWAITQQVVVITFDISVQPIGPAFLSVKNPKSLGFLTLDDWTDLSVPKRR